MIAESDHTIEVGNDYFPPESVPREFLVDSVTHTRWPWKGLASYYNIVLDGKTNGDGAWYYPRPSPAAAEIKDYVAFWHGVRITP